MKKEMSCEKQSPVLPIVVGAGVTLFALAYAIFPFDVINDFAIGVGQLDDLVVLIIGTVTDIIVAVMVIKRLFQTISSSNTQAYACADDCIEADFVEG